MRLSDLENFFEAAKTKPEHIRTVCRDLLHIRSYEPKPNRLLPARLLNGLPLLRKDFESVLTVVDTKVSEDAQSQKFLFALKDGRTIESVLLPREACCVSCQVGCAVGCVFCTTGQSGLIRQLDPIEIIAQAAYAIGLRPSTKRVVFMGMGEPSHNLGAVMRAVDFLAEFGELKYKDLVISSVGDRRLFKTLMDRRIKPALALSLHSTQDSVRRKLLPNAPAVPVGELFQLGEEYARAGKYPIQYEWTLIDGVNDSQEEISNLKELLKNRYAMINFIAYNPVPGSSFKRPPRKKMLSIIRDLRNSGCIATIRDSAAQGIEGGCGQLRARHIKTEVLAPMVPILKE